MIYKKVMIVDDDADILALLEEKLTDASYKVITAVRGREAVTKAKYYLPDIIFMDIVLPDIDGAEAVKLLQEDEETVGIPVVFLSGIVTKDRSSGAPEIKVGDRSYKAIAKPFSFADILDEVRKRIK